MILYFGNKLSKHGYTPTFIELLSPKLAERYPVVSVSNKRNKYVRLLHMVFIFFKYKNVTKLVLIDTYSTSNFYYALTLSVLSQIYKKKYIPITRGGNLMSRLQNSPTLSKYIFRRSETNISPSLYLKEVFQEHNFEIVYIPNSISIKSYPFKERRKVSIKLLWVRSFHKIYNPELAIEVANILRQQFDEVQLCMVGPDKDGSLKRLEALTKKYKLENCVKFTGQLAKSEWLLLSRNYDIFINTTDFDNHPVSVIEAMALGLPVVSTRVGGIPYLIQDRVNGLLVPKNNPKAFVRAIEFLLEDPLLVRNITVNARIKVEGLDWEIVKQSWFELIDKNYF